MTDEDGKKPPPVDNSVPGGGPLPGDDPLTAGQPLPDQPVPEQPVPVVAPAPTADPVEIPPALPATPTAAQAGPTPPPPAKQRNSKQRNTPRTILIVLAIALLILLPIGIYLALSSMDDDDPIAPITAEPTPTVTVTVAPPVATACTTDQVAVALGVGSAGSVPIVISNVGAAECTLDGYPGVAFVGGESMVPIGAAATPDPLTPASVVLLEPGSSGQAVLTIADIEDPETCQETPALGIAVDLPGPSGPLLISTTEYTACANTEVSLLTVGAVEDR